MTLKWMTQAREMEFGVVLMFRAVGTRRRALAGLTATALIFLSASTQRSLAHNAGSFNTCARPLTTRRCWLTRPEQRSSQAGVGSVPATHFDHSAQAIVDGTQNGVDNNDALSSLRGGGARDDPSVFTLFVRVFVPTFRRDGAGEESLDLDGGGLLRRLRRLYSGVICSVMGKGGKAGAGRGAGADARTKKAKETTSSHLEKTYRPGNANYRIQKELKEFMANPPENCKISVGKNIRVWIITIIGAEGTVYAGEKFRLRISFPADYPTKPPGVYFLQTPPPPKHQHIYTNGDICLSLLSSRDWKPNLTVMSLALSILSMLSSAKEKRLPEDNAAHADAKPGQEQQWIYHDDSC